MKSLIHTDSIYYQSSVSYVAYNAKATAMSMNSDESLLIVRGTFSRLFDSETSVISYFIAVDVVSGQLVGTVGPPCRGVAPAVAEFVNGSDDVLLITYTDLTGITHFALQSSAVVTHNVSSVVVYGRLSSVTEYIVTKRLKLQVAQ